MRNLREIRLPITKKALRAGQSADERLVTSAAFYRISRGKAHELLRRTRQGNSP